MPTRTSRTIREGVRGLLDGYEMQSDGRTLSGLAIPTNTYTTIGAGSRNAFVERIAPNAARSILDGGKDRAGLKILFAHGKDGTIGDKPIAVPRTVQEDSRGVWHESTLLDGVPELVKDGLKAGVYQASWRFRALSEDVSERPARSAHNPLGLPERTVTDMHVSELSVVTFPAYSSTSSMLRSRDGTEVRSLELLDLAGGLVPYEDVQADWEAIEAFDAIYQDKARWQRAVEYVTSHGPVAPVAPAKPKRKRVGWGHVVIERRIPEHERRTVKISRRAVRIIREAVAESRGQHEVGGALASSDTLVSWRPAEITAATAWATKATIRSLTLPEDIEEGLPDMCGAVGVWHLHPKGSDKLSRADESHFRDLAELYDRNPTGEFFAILVTLNKTKPVLSGYRFTRSKSKLYGYERINLVEEK